MGTPNLVERKLVSVGALGSKSPDEAKPTCDHNVIRHISDLARSHLLKRLNPGTSGEGPAQSCWSHCGPFSKPLSWGVLSSHLSPR